MLKNKRVLLTIFVAILVFLIPNMVNATEKQTTTSTINGVTVNWEYELNESNQVENLKCTNVGVLSGSISIPSTIDEKTVVSIGNEAFKRATGITEVTIPSSVKELGAMAFEECTLLSKVNLGSIESIRYDVFKGCTSLTSITIPKTLKSGSIFPCLNNTNITNIIFEEGLTVIPQSLCANTGITEITIPKSVTKIDSSAFENCTGITEVTIPSSVKELGAMAFKDCTALKKVDLGSIESIKYDVFEGCTSLTSITIPKTLKSGSIFPCLNNTNITNIIFEEGLTVIPQSLCKNTGITEITIPKSVTKIDSSAFENCTGITEVTIPSSVKELGAMAFKDCTALKKVDLGSIESIRYDVFEGCTSLTSIKIPKTLKSGSVFPCLNNTNITNIIFEEGLTVIPQSLCANTGITEITIPKSVTKIEFSAFENCKELKKITILDNVKEIAAFTDWYKPSGDGAFENHNEDLTIYCYEDSIAAKYAIEHNIKYVFLSKPAETEENKEQTEENKQNNEEKKPENTKPENTKPDNTIAPGSIPYTGGTFAIILTTIGIIAISVYAYKRNNDLKGI